MRNKYPSSKGCVYNSPLSFCLPVCNFQSASPHVFAPVCPLFPSLSILLSLLDENRTSVLFHHPILPNPLPSSSLGRLRIYAPPGPISSSTLSQPLNLLHSSGLSSCFHHIRSYVSHHSITPPSSLCSDHGNCFRQAKSLTP
jgi:hypothetical protein